MARHAYGRPREEPEEPLPTHDLDLTTLSNDELHALRRRLLAEQGAATTTVSLLKPIER